MGSLRRPRFRGNPPTRELPTQPPPPFGMIATQVTFRSRRKLSDDEPKFDAGGLVVLTAKGVQTPNISGTDRCCAAAGTVIASTKAVPIVHIRNIRVPRLCRFRKGPSRARFERPRP